MASDMNLNPFCFENKPNSRFGHVYVCVCVFGSGDILLPEMSTFIH